MVSCGPTVKSKQEGENALGKELRVNVGEDTTLGDDDLAEETVELLVVADGKLKVTGNDAGLLVVTGEEREVSDGMGRGERRKKTYRAALPASSRISADKYSRTAAR
jgi:hypothetical protein